MRAAVLSNVTWQFKISDINQFDLTDNFRLRGALNEIELDEPDHAPISGAMLEEVFTWTLLALWSILWIRSLYPLMDIPLFMSGLLGWRLHSIPLADPGVIFRHPDVLFSRGSPITALFAAFPLTGLLKLLRLHITPFLL
jgi:hypothetical protein